jgi:hypothetical protein
MTTIDDQGVKSMEEFLNRFGFNWKFVEANSSIICGKFGLFLSVV